MDDDSNKVYEEICIPEVLNRINNKLFSLFSAGLDETKDYELKSFMNILDKYMALAIEISDLSYIVSTNGTQLDKKRMSLLMDKFKTRINVILENINKYYRDKMQAIKDDISSINAYALIIGRIYSTNMTTDECVNYLERMIKNNC